MVDILISRGKHRATIIPQTKVGHAWIWENYSPSDILQNDAVMIHMDYVEDTAKTLEKDDIEYELR